MSETSTQLNTGYGQLSEATRTTAAGNTTFVQVTADVDGSGKATAISAGNPLPVADAALATGLGTLATASGQASALTQQTAAAAGIGTSGDGAWSGTGPASLVAALKAIWGKLAGTLAVSGAVSVSNLPATQTVSGSVSVSNLPATQTVSGTVGLAAGTQAIGSVSVSNLPATQPVSAASLPLPTGAATSALQPAINADGGAQTHVMNFPATQAVSGTVGVSGTVAVQDTAAIGALGAIQVNTAVAGAITLADRSATSTVAATSTALVPANAARNRLIVQAPQGAGVWLNLVGGTAAANGAACLYLPSGAVFDEPITNAVTYYIGTAGLVIAAFEA